MNHQIKEHNLKRTKLTMYEWNYFQLTNYFAEQEEKSQKILDI